MISSNIILKIKCFVLIEQTEQHTIFIEMGLTFLSTLP